MNDIILLKLGELVLKGLNRRNFEDRLMANIQLPEVSAGQKKEENPNLIGVRLKVCW